MNPILELIDHVIGTTCGQCSAITDHISKKGFPWLDLIVRSGSLLIFFVLQIYYTQSLFVARHYDVAFRRGGA